MSSSEPEQEQEDEEEQEELDRQTESGRATGEAIRLRVRSPTFKPWLFYRPPSPLPEIVTRIAGYHSQKRDELEEAQNVFRDHGLGNGSRSERKNRKAVLKLGKRPVPNIHRVTIKKSENILYIIAEPEVYQSSVTDTYVIFGQGEFEDLRNRNRQFAADQFAVQSEPEAPEIKDDPVVEEEESDVDEEGLDDKDIELVMNQASVSRSSAVRALKKCDQDSVSAIMELTMN